MSKKNKSDFLDADTEDSSGEGYTPEASDKNSEEATETKPAEPKKMVIGGMKKKKWKDKDLFVCPRCGDTTFDPVEAKNHSCPKK